MKLASGVRGRILMLAAAVLAVACSKHDEQTVPKGNRQVAVHITQAELNSYDAEFQRVKALGVDVVPFTIPWNSIETAGGFDFSLLSIIDSYYTAMGVKISLNITPLYAVSRAVPADLQSAAFDDPALIARFNALLDSIHVHLPHASINNFIIGLEADLYLSAHTSEWNAYTAFFESSRDFVKDRWGTAMPVGVETTWSAAAVANVEQVQKLNKHSDMMVLSYYPNQADFTVKPPSQVHQDVEIILGLYQNMPTFIVECGYQTSADCNSSPELQRQFVEEMFKLWDAHQLEINFIGFLWLTDLPDAAVDQYVIDYNASSFPSLTAFRAYLQTTGLRTYPGTGADKPGFTQLRTELKARGW